MTVLTSTVSVSDSRRIYRQASRRLRRPSPP